MNENKGFLKGFLLAGALAVIFMAGRVSAAPESAQVVDVSRAVENLTREVSEIGDEVGAIRRDGLKVEQKYGSDWSVKVKK